MEPVPRIEEGTAFIRITSLYAYYYQQLRAGQTEEKKSSKSCCEYKRSEDQERSRYIFPLQREKT